MLSRLSTKLPTASSNPPLCTQCGYDLSANPLGRCPECGRDAPLSPHPRSPEVLLAAALLAALLPIAATVAETFLGKSLYNSLTSAYTAGDPRFNDAATLVSDLVFLSHWLITPMLAIPILILGLRRQQLGWMSLLVVIPTGIIFLLCQIAGFAFLIPRFFST